LSRRHFRGIHCSRAFKRESPVFDYKVTIEAIAAGFELVGVGIVVAGFVASLIKGAGLWTKQGAGAAYVGIRSTFGRSILLGLEVLVAGDIIRTVALQPTLENLVVLGLLVVIRTFLAWSLEVEIDGRWPWKRAQAEKDCSDRSV
jgi:uncharacterized membrane protein